MARARNPYSRSWLWIPGPARSLSSGGAKAPTHWGCPGMTGCGDDGYRFEFQTARVTDTASQSRGAMRPRLAETTRLENEGVGNAGRTVHPQASCARVESRKHTSSHGRTGITRHPRTQWSYGLYRALPGDRAFLPPSSLRSLLLKNLTPASGRQDHTALPYATRLSPKPSAGLVPVRRNSSEGGNSAIRPHILCR
jgi:hypothetical protein